MTATDEGISGTSLRHRDAFSEMINDCIEHKIDMIITKSVSRFARNIVDCIGTVRKLAELNPPIGVRFEADNIFTLDEDSEMRLAIMATFAQEESHTKSNIMNASIDMRFHGGVYLTPPLLGYDQDDDGNLIVNEHEAKIVRLIFNMYLYGYTCSQIADTLTELRCKTKNNNTDWNPGSVLQILRNERHCGKLIARKTYTPNYLNHKSKKNNNNRNQYKVENHHEAIISKEDFIAVQHFINNAKYGSKRILPEIIAIDNGLLNGYVVIHPHWAGFTAADYINISKNIQASSIPTTEKDSDIVPNNGEFDFRGYEIARAQFFNTTGKVFVTISNKQLQFSSGSINKFKDNSFIEILINTEKKHFAVRIANSKKNTAVKWSKRCNGALISKSISGAAYMKTIYDIMDWEYSLKYRIQGTFYQKDNESVIIYDMNDTEILLPAVSDYTDNLATTAKSVIGYPAEWATGFGKKYYTYAQIRELEDYHKTGVWNISHEGIKYPDESVADVKGREDICKTIDLLKNEIKRDIINEK